MKAIPETLKEELAREFTQEQIEEGFKRQFLLSKTKELLKELRISRQAGSPKKKTEEIACENAGYLGFMESSLQELGLEEVLWEKVSEVVKEKSEASEARPNYKNKNKSSRFTNPPGSFKTVDSRDDINYKGHDIAKTSTRCNLGKLRELLSLSITTVNGRFNELADSSSKTMRQAFCGFHYQPATIDKFFRELKYYDLEHALNQTQGQFWFNVWNSDPGKTVILFVDNKMNHLYTEKNCAMGKIGSTGEVDYCMGGCYLNDRAGHFLGVHPTCGQLHLPVGAEMVLDDFQSGLADETVNLIIVGDRELRSVPHLVETKENKNTSCTRKHVQRESITPRRNDNALSQSS